MSDHYDYAVEYLTKNPGEIESAWLHPDRSPGGCLFLPVAPSRSFPSMFGKETPIGGGCGCLTTIKGGWPSHGNAWTRELTDAILADDRIPNRPDKIGVEHLPIFAEWQRRIDKELNRQ